MHRGEDILSMGGSSDDFLESLLTPTSSSTSSSSTKSFEQKNKVPKVVEFDEDGLKIKEGSIEEQILQFKELIVEGDVQMMITRALGGSFSRDCFVRSLAWKVFLGVLPSHQFPKGGADMELDRSHWMKESTRMRTHFRQLVNKHFIDPRKLEDAHNDEDLEMVNPLSQSVENPWSQFFENNELEKTILQDLHRLYPEHPFFRTKPVQQLMLRVLFVWSKENSDTSYRQGMHELLAPMLLVFHRDYKKKDSFAKVIEMGGENAHIAELLSELVNEEHLEADLYAIFEKLMGKMKDYFLVVEKSSSRDAIGSKIHLGTQNSLFKGTEDALFSMASSDWSQQQQQQQQHKHKKKQEEMPFDPHMNTPLYKICDRIQNGLLKKKDPHLHEHLVQMGIEPQIYGLRWIRLLFGREFHLEDVITLWDAIFADCGGFRHTDQNANGQDSKTSNLDFSLVEHIAIMMLIYIRAQLMSCDSSLCLRRLMKYPPVESVHIFVTKALESRQTPNERFTSFVDPILPGEEESQKVDQDLTHNDDHSPKQHQKQQPQKKKSGASMLINSKKVIKHKALPSLFGSGPSGLFSSSNLADTSRSAQGSRAPSTASQNIIPDAKVRQIVNKEIKLGEAMERLLSDVQRELFEKPQGTSDEAVLLMSIAKLKHIKDILKFQLELELEELEWIMDTGSKNNRREEEGEEERALSETTLSSPANETVPQSSEGSPDVQDNYNFVDPLLR